MPGTGGKTLVPLFSVIPPKSKMTSESSTPVGLARSALFTAGSTTSSSASPAVAETARRTGVARQLAGSAAMSSGRQASTALNRSAAAKSSSRMAAIRAHPARPVSVQAISPVAAVKVAAIRLSFITTPISPSASGKSAHRPSATANARRLCLAAQATSKAYPPQ